MLQKVKQGKMTITILYLAALIGLGCIVVGVLVTRTKPGEIRGVVTHENISGQLTLDIAGTQPVDVNKLGSYIPPETGELLLYYQLPQFKGDTSLVYRSKDVYTSVSIEEEQIYETTVYESRWYNHSPGNLWNVVSLDDSYSGKCLQICVHIVYNANAVTLDSVYLGDKADIIFELLQENLSGITVSLLLILVGVVMILICFLPAFCHMEKHYGAVWGGVFAILTGLWSLIETNMLQFFVSDMRILQLLDNLIMLCANIPLLLYLNSEYNLFKHRSMRLLAYINVLSIYAAIALQCTNRWDVHYALPFSNLLLIVTDVCLIFWVVVTLVRLKREKKPLLNLSIQLLGFCCLLICGVLQTVSSMRVDTPDRAGLVRVGMLLLSICLSASSQIETYKIMEHGLKYNLVKNLAYLDGLTGLGNRTAYLEQIDAYTESKKIPDGLGIIFLDVNNLKQVNDHQGHEYGDELIKTAAGIIQDSFGRYGNAYRIGGDEFCVFIAQPRPEAKYQESRDLFLQLVHKSNETGNYTFDICIAHGFALCRDLTHENIEAAVAEADSEMYKNKLSLKQAQGGNSARF